MAPPVGTESWVDMEVIPFDPGWFWLEERTPRLFGRTWVSMSTYSFSFQLQAVKATFIIHWCRLQVVISQRIEGKKIQNKTCVEIHWVIFPSGFPNFLFAFFSVKKKVVQIWILRDCVCWGGSNKKSTYVRLKSLLLGGEKDSSPPQKKMYIYLPGN